MQEIIDNYFDDIFVNLEQDCLMLRHKRNELTESLAAFIQCSVDQQFTCGTIVRAALNFHQNAKRNNSGVCLMGKHHNILYVAGRLCSDWQLEDNTILVQLFTQIYECENTFERLFIGAIFGSKVTQLISGWRTEYADDEASLLALDYFLDHARQAKLSFIINQIQLRLIDFPMESYDKGSPLNVAAYMEKPTVLLLLLRYGATPSNIYQQSSTNYPLITLIKKLSIQALNAAVDEKIMYPAASVSCLKLFLRATLQLPRSIKKLQEGIGGATLTDSFYQSNIIHPRLIEDGIVPKSRYSEPAELKHICRCCIRSYLYPHWQLPTGIKTLEIPDSLKDYLDLQID